MLSIVILGVKGGCCQENGLKLILYEKLILLLWILYGLYIIVYGSVSELYCNPPLLDYEDWGTTFMKMAISFICGVAVCGLIIFGVRPLIPTRAGTVDSVGASDNTSLNLSNIIPDFEKIYQDALTAPFIKAESKITDPDIAEYYHELMEKTGLTDTGTSAN